MIFHLRRLTAICSTRRQRLMLLAQRIRDARWLHGFYCQRKKHYGYVARGAVSDRVALGDPSNARITVLTRYGVKRTV